jgi:hypothetical protein
LAGTQRLRPSNCRPEFISSLLFIIFIIVYDYLLG